MRKSDDGMEIIVKAPQPTGASSVVRTSSIKKSRIHNKNNFPQKKACPLIKQERREKKFLKDIQKLGLQVGKTIQVGIAKDLYCCQVAMIGDLHVYLFYQGQSYQLAQDASKYSLKSIKRMFNQAEHLNGLKNQRAANRARGKIRRLLFCAK